MREALQKAIGEMSLEFNAIDHLLQTACAAMLRCREERLALKLLHRYHFDAKAKLADEIAKHYEDEHPVMSASAKHFRALMKIVRQVQEKRNKIMHALISDQFGQNGLPLMLVTTEWNPIEEDLETVAALVQAMKTLNTELLYAYADMRLKIAEVDGDDPALRGSGEPFP
jgi:hypothetical protein